jgi:hypothetical protein
MIPDSSLHGDVVRERKIGVRLNYEYATIKRKE